MRLTVDATDELLERIDAFLNSRLSERVIVLDAVEQLGEAPEAIGFQLAHVGSRQRLQVTVSHVHA